jgi:hypothetical protein
LINKHVNDSVFDALFRQAVIDNFFTELDSLPSDDTLAELYSFSAEHELRMKRLFARDARIERFHTALIWSKRVAAAIILAMSILFGSLMFVPEVRAVVYETITEWYEKFVRFTSNAPTTDKVNHEPGYIPEGFQEYLRDELGTMTTIIYLNDSGVVIQFETCTLSNSISVDNEDRRYIVERKDNTDYHVFTSVVDEKMNSIIWEQFGQRYHVSSTLSLDEIWKIALSVGN